MVASDKLFFWLFQERSQCLQPLVASLVDDMEGYGFSAPAIKELEVRLDGLFLPASDQLAHKPALILEAQMAGQPDFFLRLYSESGLVLRQQQRQGQPLRHWGVVVICPSKDLSFGDPLPVRECLRERVIWIELAPDRLPPNAPPLQKALSLLRLPEEQLPATAEAVRQDATGTPLAEEVDTVIAAILVARFCKRSLLEICAMGGLTIDDFTNSAVYKEIFGQGRSEGLQEGQREGLERGQREGRQAEAAAPPPFACASSNAAAAPSPPNSRPASKLCPSPNWKPSPMPCSTFRGRTT